MGDLLDESRAYTDRQVDLLAGSIRDAVHTLSEVGKDGHKMSQQMVQLVAEVKHTRETGEDRFLAMKERHDQLAEALDKEEETRAKETAGLRLDLDSHLAASEEHQAVVERNRNSIRWWATTGLTLLGLGWAVFTYYYSQYLTSRFAQLESLIRTLR
jgi:hypothetical protein